MIYDTVASHVPISETLAFKPFSLCSFFLLLFSPWLVSPPTPLYLHSSLFSLERRMRSGVRRWEQRLRSSMRREPCCWRPSKTWSSRWSRRALTRRLRWLMTDQHFSDCSISQVSPLENRWDDFSVYGMTSEFWCEKQSIYHVQHMHRV